MACGEWFEGRRKRGEVEDEEHVDRGNNHSELGRVEKERGGRVVHVHMDLYLQYNSNDW